MIHSFPPPNHSSLNLFLSPSIDSSIPSFIHTSLLPSFHIHPSINFCIPVYLHASKTAYLPPCLPVSLYLPVFLSICLSLSLCLSVSLSLRMPIELWREN